MTIRTLRRSVCRTTVLAAASIVAVAAPTSAAPPERIQIDDSETFQFDLCGIPSSVDFVETGTLTIQAKGSDGLNHYTAHLEGNVVDTNLLTGKSVLLTRTLKDQDVRVVAGPGDLIFISGQTIVREDDYNEDGSLAFRTYGRQAWSLVVDTLGNDDDEDDVVVSEENGPLQGRNDRADADFCAWYADQTS